MSAALKSSIAASYLPVATRHLAARLIGRLDERVAVDGVVEIGDRLHAVALPLIDEPARVIGLRVLGLQPDRRVEVGHRVVEMALRAQQIAAPEIGRRVVRDWRRWRR